MQLAKVQDVVAARIELKLLVAAIAKSKHYSRLFIWCRSCRPLCSSVASEDTNLAELSLAMKLLI